VTWVYLAASTTLLALVSFAVTASASVTIVVLWAIAVGVVSLLFVRLLTSFGRIPSAELMPMVMAGVVIGGGAALKWLIQPENMRPVDAGAILVAMASAWLTDLLPKGQARRCFICKQPVQEAAPFTCPRCHQVICSRPSCWAARHFRCRYCHEREVIIFPSDERWWRARLGPRVSKGSCSSCYKESGEADLRECGQCSWPMCKRCWDYHNGRCTHCEWVLPELPASLAPFVASTGRQTREVQIGARRRP
jgi:hypothetical protein